MKPVSIIVAVLFIVLVTTGGALLHSSDFIAHPFSILTGIILLISAAAILGRPVAALVTSGAGRLFFPGNRDRKLPPSYSPAQACRMRGDYEGAMKLYGTIVTEYPQEITAWRSLVEIAGENMHDVERARSILERGLTVLVNEPHRRLLQEAFNEGTRGVTVRKPVTLA